MHKTVLILFLFCLLTSSCKSKEFIAMEDAEMYSLEATQISNDQVKRLLRSITNPTEINFEDNNLPIILIINKKVFNKDQMRSVLDTIQIKNYTIKINKNIRSMILTSK